jgi:hypothetical protein
VSRLGGLLAAGALALAALPATANAAPPAPCNNAPQITDVSGDGHHPGTDVLAAWWSEATGHLTATIQVRSGLFVAEHDDAQVNGSGFALIYNGTSYLRALAPAQDHASDPVAFDYGTYANGVFTSAGTTTGSVEKGPNGTVTIDTAAVPGTRLSAPYVLTWDGINAGVPTWVDHAPGGQLPDDPSVGADYIAGSCNPVVAPPTTTAITIAAPRSVTGRKTITVTGRVTPARGGVTVTLGKQSTTTAADGSYSLKVTIGETTRLRATAEGIGSDELTVTAKAKVKIKVKRRKDGSAVVTGTVDPKLPGRVLWLRTTAVKPSARTKTTTRGTFRLVLKHPKKGRYQAVFIPSGERAERATSNTGVIR